jgi:two-component system phosphate regulon response regulator PhoB
VKKRILIADDDDSLRLLLQATLRDSRYEIMEATGGVQALALREKHSPDLVILDITMPGLSGLEVCRMIKENPQSAATPVIMLTASGHASDRTQAATAGADEFMAKPFSPLALLGMVERLLTKE